MHKIARRKLMRQCSQAGITLLLAVLVLSAILAISFSLATIIFIEVRSSGDLIRTEPTYYASQALSEDSFFKIRRQVTGTNFPLTTKLNNVNATTTTSLREDPIMQDMVPASSVDIPNSKNRYLIYNPEAPYYPPTQLGPLFSGSGYGLLRVTYLDTGTTGDLNVYICQFDPNDTTIDADTCNNASSANSRFVYNTTLHPGEQTSDSMVAGAMDPTKQQELIIYGDADPAENRWVLIQGFASDGTTPQGIPYFGQTVMDITASSTNLTRRLRINVPE